MDMPVEDVAPVAVDRPKPRSLEVIAPAVCTRAPHPALTERGPAMATIVPLRNEPRETLSASPRVTEPVGGTDLTAPMGEGWAVKHG